MHRAAHQLLEKPPLFDDPHALRILGPEAEARVRAGANDSGAARTAGLRLFIAARSRFSEDMLAEAFGRGVRQYVLLGAGLDTFAYRAAKNFAELRVFEVDHPATQAWKRERLALAGIEVPRSLTFAPIDFERESLSDALAAAGFDARQPAVFAWLGVVPYLTRQAIMATLGTIARMARGSIVVFEYAEPPEGQDGLSRTAMDALAERVAAAGEPFQSLSTSNELAHELGSMRFSHVEDWDAAKMNARYFEERQDGLRLGPRGHLMHARV